MPLYLFIFLSLMIGGCSITSSTPPVQQYTLVHDSSVRSVNSMQCPKSLQLSPFQSSPLNFSKTIQYRYNDGRSGAYLYSQWNESPAIMLEKAQLDTLEKNSLFQTVIPASSLAKPLYRLESELHTFQHVIHSDGTSEGILVITNRLILMQTKNVIVSKRFSFRFPSKSTNAEGGVEALNQAVNAYVLSLNDWLNESIRGECK